MSGPIDMGVQLAASAARVGWFYGINQMVDARARGAGQKPGYRPKRPVPAQRELMGSLGELLLADATAVRDGVAPPPDTETLSMSDHVGRLRRMFADLPDVFARRGAARADSARTTPNSKGLPEYYTQDFHFQTGGYLSPESAALYDVQVETLFYGSATAMRRSALRPLAEALRGRDQRGLAMLDVACGTGRFLRQTRLMWPALRLTGLDLSQPYLDEAARHMGTLRPARLIAGNAEAMPVESASQDVVSVIFMFHELPGDVRRRVIGEIARVLKPGGTLLFVDSLQIGDRPGWDGLLEAFPIRFHEPYFRQYAIDDLDAALTEAGLAPVSQDLPFLAKLMVRRRAQ
jgi:ubiquinone/menaquinone biosynthesis C-methylase UbiE